MDNFDDASVYTIHGFCREMLDKCLFSQGGQFDCEFGADDELRAQVVDEFMRRELLNPDFDPAFKTRILEKSDFDAVLKTVVTLSQPGASGRSGSFWWRNAHNDSPEEEALLRRFIDWAPARLANSSTAPVSVRLTTSWLIWIQRSRILILPGLYEAALTLF